VAVRPAGGKWRDAVGWTALHGHWLRRRHFGPAAMQQLTQAIRASEANHAGELVLALESSLPGHVDDSRERALEVFGRLRVWDTPQRTGVLLYLALGEHCIELVADRGVQGGAAAWPGICSALQQRLRAGDYLPGLLDAIAALERELAAHCAPEPPGTPNRLPDAPVVL